MTTPLPAAPSLEQLRKQAKDLVRERSEAGPEPLRAQRGAARRRTRVRLRELAAAQGLRRARRGARPGADVRVRGRRRLLRGSRRGPAQRRRERARERRSRSCGPTIRALADASDAEMRAMSPPTRGSCSRASTDSRAGSVPPPRRGRWPRAASRSGGRSRPSRRATARRSARLLDRYPGLVVGARHERQRPARPGASRPAPARQSLVRELLARGADPSSANDRGWTPLHQAGYGNDLALARLLLDAGARTDLSAHGEGGTPLAAALFWGHREVADLLAEREVVAAQPAHRGGPRPPRPDPRARATPTGA